MTTTAVDFGAAAPPARRVWAALIPAMVLPFVGALLYFAWLHAHPAGRVIYGLTKVFTLVWPLIAIRYVLDGRWPRPSFDWRRDLASLPLGIAWGAIIGWLGFALYDTPLGELVRESAPAIRAKVEATGFIHHYWTFGILLASAHALIEEYYWRWFVYGRLRTIVRSRVAAHVKAGAAFAAHHIVVATQFFPPLLGVLLGLSVGAGGIIWSVLYERQRTIIGAWVCHCMADVALFAIGHHIIFGTWV